MPNEALYLKKFLDPLKVCKRYKPKMGQGNKEGGVGLDQFLEMYAADPFYAWIGLDSALMYSAHKAAGGMWAAAGFMDTLLRCEDETGGGLWEREGNSAGSSKLKQSSWSRSVV